MSRDLFAATFARRPAPTRSKWTIAGSLVAHVLVVAALLVLPVLSALDSYAVHARHLTFVVPTPPVIPAMPVPPPKLKARPAPDFNPKAAPLTMPENRVTGDAVTTTGNELPPGWIPDPTAGRFTGVIGTGRSVVEIPPAPTARPPEPLRAGGVVSIPKRIAYVDPIYPPLAIAAKVEGPVILEATIDETGIVRDVKVLRSSPLLDQAAIDAVKKWRYTPTRLNGVAVPVLLTVTVMFSLR